VAPCSASSHNPLDHSLWCVWNKVNTICAVNNTIIHMCNEQRFELPSWTGSLIWLTELQLPTNSANTLPVQQTVQLHK
jgi:hypothetical protein